MTTSHSWTAMDEDPSSQESRDADRLSMICSFHSLIGKEEGKAERGRGWGCCSKAAAFASTHWFQVGPLWKGWKEEREALVPSRCRAQFPVERRTRWQWLRDKVTVVERIVFFLTKIGRGGKPTRVGTVYEVFLYSGTVIGIWIYAGTGSEFQTGVRVKFTFLFFQIFSLFLWLSTSETFFFTLVFVHSK